MSIKNKLLLPLLFGMSFVIGIFHYYWEPNELAMAKSEYQTDILQLMKFGESDLVRNILQNDIASLYSAIQFQQEIKQDSWFNLKFYDETGLQIYPITKDRIALTDDQEFIHISHPIEISGTQLGRMEVDVDWSEDKSRILANLNNIKFMIIGIMGLILIISLLTQHKIIYLPLKQLKRAAEQLSQGNFAAELTESSKDEIGDLTRTFIKMKQQLKSTHDDLIKALQQAEAASISKSSFLATMSHEIRTPMNGVIGMTQLLQGTPLNDEQQEYLETIAQSGNSLLGTINDILDFSKLDADMTEIESISFDLERVCLESMELLAGNNMDKKLEFIFDFHPECPRQFIGDPSRIRQILINLLGNAIKFTEHGFIRLGVSNITAENGDEELRLEVQDTGIGLKAAAIEQLFDEFTQADASTTRQYGGTGLGLAITRKLVTLMNGNIGVDSIYGEGSTFWINIQLAKADTPLILNESSLEGIRVLFVDGNQKNHDVYSRLLQYMGLEVTISSQPDQVIDLLHLAIQGGRPYRIAILDYMMPNTSGLELGRQIRKETQFIDLKLLIFSSAGQKGDASTFAQAGFNAYANKLCRYDTMQTILSVMLNHQPGSRIITQHSIEESKKSLNEKEHSFSASILLVEDILPNQIIARKFLNRMGLQVDIANDGLQAIEAFKNNHYDLIFMDCRMPVMDGYEATRSIRQFERENTQKSVPIIALTANASSEDRIICQKSGMNDVITKPFKQADLSNCLLTWLPV